MNETKCTLTSSSINPMNFINPIIHLDDLVGTGLQT